MQPQDTERDQNQVRSVADATQQETVRPEAADAAVN